MFKSVGKSRLIMMGGTLTCALGIGVLMQMTAAGPATADKPALQTSAVAVSSFVAEPTIISDATEEAAVAPVQDKIAADTVSKTEEQTPAEQPTDIADVAEPALGTKASDMMSSAASEVTFDAVTLTRAEANLPEPSKQPASPEAKPVELELAALGNAPVADLPQEETDLELTCEMEMTALSDPAAVVTLDLDAPCMANERFTLHHNGMMITGVTDEAGTWQADIPALSEQALFIVAFANGEGTIANADVAALSQYDRYVVQWKGYSGMQIHALEYGADYGQAGHVWHDTSRGSDVALRGEGGFLMRLGETGMDDALRAEVYSFPSGNAQRDGDVKISLETEITQANCGRDVEAQALIKTADGMIGARDLNLAVPDCNAVGDFLVLKNLYEDLRIARN